MESVIMQELLTTRSNTSKAKNTDTKRNNSALDIQ